MKLLMLIIICLTVTFSFSLGENSKKTIVFTDNENSTLSEIINQRYPNQQTLFKESWTSKDLVDSLEKFDRNTNKYIFIMNDVSHIENGDFNLRLSPNPFYGRSYLHLTVNDPRYLGKGFRVAMYNRQGKSVKNIGFAVYELGENEIYMGDLGVLPSDTYFLKLYHKGEVLATFECYSDY